MLFLFFPQAIHVQKAINNLEGATKEKHLRAIILGTFKYQGGLTFWTHASKLSVQGHPIVCWKFCHVVYKLLREGHINVSTPTDMTLSSIPARIKMRISEVFF